MAKTAQQWFDEYGESHQNPINKAIHWLAVPVIFLTVVGLLWAIPVPEFMAAIPYLNWASLAMIAAALFYISISRTLGLGMVVFMIGSFAIVHWFVGTQFMAVWKMSVILFVIMWILQFIGHAVEGKKPSFFKDIQFLLIGPAWLMGFIYQKIGIRY